MAKYTDREALTLFVGVADEVLGSEFATEIVKGVSTKIAIKDGELVSIGQERPEQRDAQGLPPNAADARSGQRP